MRRWLKSKISQVSICPLDSPSHPRGTWPGIWLCLSIPSHGRQRAGGVNGTRHRISALRMKYSAPVLNLSCRLETQCQHFLAWHCTWGWSTFFLSFMRNSVILSGSDYTKVLYLCWKKLKISYSLMHIMSQKNTFYRIQNWDVNMCPHISYLAEPSPWQHIRWVNNGVQVYFFCLCVHVYVHFLLQFLFVAVLW